MDKSTVLEMVKQEIKSSIVLAREMLDKYDHPDAQRRYSIVEGVLLGIQMFIEEMEKREG